MVVRLECCGLLLLLLLMLLLMVAAVGQINGGRVTFHVKVVNVCSESKQQQTKHQTPHD